MRNYHIDLEPDELGRDLGKSLAASLGPAIFDREITALAPAQLTQSLDKGGGPCRSVAAVPEPSKPMSTGLLRCACAASGHAAAPPTSSVMNSRRFMLASS